MSGPWRSDRLIYRAIEPEDEPFLQAMSSDPQLFTQAAPFLPVPQSKKASVKSREWWESCLVSAVICLPPTTDVPNSPESALAKPIPIGVIDLESIDPKLIHHRRSDIGINIARPYQGQGYGSEAIKWILNWGFRYANLHRIGLGAFEYNTGAARLYERLGFVLEGRSRDFLWFEGRYWDLLTFGMLEHEWRDRYGDTQPNGSK